MGFLVSFVDGLLELIMFPFRKFKLLFPIILVGIVALGATGFHDAWITVYHDVMTALFGQSSIHLPHLPTPKKS